jgi:translation initiation factor IF-3
MDGTMVGIISLEEALALASENELGLVEISPNTVPPVCKILDFNRYKYDAKKKYQESKKKTKRVDEDRQVAKKQLFEDMVAIRDTLPLDFLFEHNLNGFVVERGMRKARKILERIRNKAILAGFDHWVKWNIKAREEEKEEEMRQFALAHGQEKLKQFLLNFLHNKISGGFKKMETFC